MDFLYAIAVVCECYGCGHGIVVVICVLQRSDCNHEIRRLALAIWGNPVAFIEVEAAGLFGSYARALGWRRGKPGGADKDPTFRLRDAAR